MENSMSAFMDNQPIGSLVSDGWTSMRNDHMVNFVAVFPLKTARPVFVKAIATDDISQTGVNIAAELDRAIVAIGVSKVGSVVTDNAACMKSAWKILEQKYPGLICNGCAAHAVNLLINDVCKLEVFANALERARDVTSFVKDRNALTKRFERIQETLLVDGEISSKRALSSVVATRWYTHYNCIARVLENCKVLAQLANTALFHDLKVTPGSRVKKAAFVDAITDATFWSNLQSMEATLRPTCSIIGKFEGDTCSASERVWSIYDFILTKRRNRLSPAKVTKLVQLYMNADLSSQGSLVSVMMGQESDAGESDDETKT
ncbi:hypothetical protein DYB37_007765 [Aphanomyces astaci]|uniref:DUF659 domain-containing protein n=1 Tax=Aphanomyces astaci TaxID=112090 RepID=A0A3R6X335_APHAT|nr:hypothetical protein DYB35_006065 [Aphanomyces astaci]RHZ27744.1 hypothetical protein DYB37_007765 [Aphanomyces astaci]